MLTSLALRGSRSPRETLGYPAMLALAGALLAACSGSSEPALDCADGKCDLPDDPAEVSCTKRRADAFNENQLAFDESFLRWSCADVQGVTNEDRGQEYCEYFAIAQLPGSSEASVLGRNLGEDSSYGESETSVELTSELISALEADEHAIVGQCVFTSWNSDVDLPVAEPAPEIAGVAVTGAAFRMMFDVNSADAAQVLVEDCFTIPDGGGDDPKDLRHDTFLRGCLWNADINETEYRKSDSTVCVSMTRLAECGCYVDGEVPLAEMISPYTRRGFPLGSWSGFVAGSEDSRLPPNCRYVALGDGSQTLVTCDLTAGDVLYGSADMKAHCAEKYADNIVVHVPIDPSPITCDPASSASPYADTCSSMPWIVTPE
jgi:hypothetical protein